MTSKRATLDAKLAEHGIKILSFDGYTLRIRYEIRRDQTMPQRGAIGGDEINQFVIDMVRNTPGDEQLFPGLGQVTLVEDI